MSLAAMRIFLTEICGFSEDDTRAIRSKAVGLATLQTEFDRQARRQARLPVPEQAVVDPGAAIAPNRGSGGPAGPGGAGSGAKTFHDSVLGKYITYTKFADVHAVARESLLFRRIADHGRFRFGIEDNLRLTVQRYFDHFSRQAEALPMGVRVTSGEAVSFAMSNECLGTWFAIKGTALGRNCDALGLLLTGEWGPVDFGRLSYGKLSLASFLRAEGEDLETESVAPDGRTNYKFTLVSALGRLEAVFRFFLADAYKGFTEDLCERLRSGDLQQRHVPGPYVRYLLEETMAEVFRVLSTVSTEDYQSRFPDSPLLEGPAGIRHYLVATLADTRPSTESLLAFREQQERKGQTSRKRGLGQLLEELPVPKGQVSEKQPCTRHLFCAFGVKGEKDKAWPVCDERQCSFYHVTTSELSNKTQMEALLARVTKSQTKKFPNAWATVMKRVAALK
jgi:hypothetical protein